jgi:hypothetical protein
MPFVDDLVYSNDRVGPWKLYIYGLSCHPDAEYHRGGVWFAKVVKYPEEEITLQEAEARYLTAFAEKRQIRITDPGDNLVLHARDGRVVYGASFWDEVSP